MLAFKKIFGGRCRLFFFFNSIQRRLIKPKIKKNKSVFIQIKKREIKKKKKTSVRLPI